MKQLFDTLSYQCSEQVTSLYSTSFSIAVRTLSPKIRNSILAIYGFVRLADEIVDSFHDYNQTLLFEELEVDLQNAIDHKISLNPILNAFQDVIHKYDIDLDLVNAFMKSMKADLHKQEYTSKEEYEGYIYGSADVVGLMCLKVFVQGDQSQYDALKFPAMKLGSAFQKVNFLRDLKDDTELLHRTYFPQLIAGSLDEKTKTQIINEIKTDFEEAYVGIKQLPVEAKFGVYTAYVYYSKLLKKLEGIDAKEIKERRVRISNPLKIGLLTKSFVQFKLNLL